MGFHKWRDFAFYFQILWLFKSLQNTSSVSLYRSQVRTLVVRPSICVTSLALLTSGVRLWRGVTWQCSWLLHCVILCTITWRRLVCMSACIWRYLSCFLYRHTFSFRPLFFSHRSHFNSLITAVQSELVERKWLPARHLYFFQSPVYMTTLFDFYNIFLLACHEL